MRVAPRVMEPLYCYYALWRRFCAFAGGSQSRVAYELFALRRRGSRAEVACVVWRAPFTGCASGMEILAG